MYIIPICIKVNKLKTKAGKKNRANPCKHTQMKVDLT